MLAIDLLEPQLLTLPIVLYTAHSDNEVLIHNDNEVLTGQQDIPSVPNVRCFNFFLNHYYVGSFISVGM